MSQIVLTRKEAAILFGVYKEKEISTHRLAINLQCTPSELGLSLRSLIEKKLIDMDYDICKCSGLGRRVGGILDEKKAFGSGMDYWSMLKTSIGVKGAITAGVIFGGPLLGPLLGGLLGYFLNDDEHKNLNILITPNDD